MLKCTWIVLAAFAPLLTSCTCGENKSYAVRTTLYQLLIGLVVLTGAGCHLIFPFQVDEVPAPQRDLGLDLPVDLAPRDGPPNEGPVDGLAPHEAIPPSDTAPPTPDAPPLPDAAPQPCAGGPIKETLSSTMVTCGAPPTGAAKVSQCKAEGYCNVAQGWKLCTATQYKARGGATKGAVHQAWLKACVRSGGAPHDPLDAICTCDGTLGPKNVQLAWSASSSGWVSLVHLHVGVCAYWNAYKVGTNQAKNLAHWSVYPAASTMGAAVCCK